MNKIEAIIRPEKLSDVQIALKDAGYTGMTIIRSEGQGDNPGVTMSAGRAGTSKVYALAKIKLEMVISDDDTDEVMKVIREAAATGRPGDGRIFVSPVIDTVRIDTGESGADSLR